MDSVTIGWPLAVLLSVLAGGAALVVRAAGFGPARPVLTAGFLMLMVLVSTGTSARRITGSLRPRSWWTGLPIIAGVAPVLGAVLASNVVPLVTVSVLPVGGILIGGTMTATTLAGRRTVEELTDRRGEFEAALSLGLSRRDSVGLVGRPAAALALVPGRDQTRTVGLVTLPGAFVGVLLAGASPLQAGAAQVLVLVALLLVQAVAAAVTVELVAAGRLSA